MDSLFIVVWRGAITQYGFIKNLVEPDDEVFLANTEEAERYIEFKKNEK